MGRNKVDQNLLKQAADFVQGASVKGKIPNGILPQASQRYGLSYSVIRNYLKKVAPTLVGRTRGPNKPKVVNTVSA